MAAEGQVGVAGVDSWCVPGLHHASQSALDSGLQMQGFKAGRQGVCQRPMCHARFQRRQRLQLGLTAPSACNTLCNTYGMQVGEDLPYDKDGCAAGEVRGRRGATVVGASWETKHANGRYGCFLLCGH